MEELLTGLIGKKVDVGCGNSAVYRGEILKVADGVLHIRDEDEKTAYIAVDKIATVYECSDSASRPGFIG